MIVGVVCYCIWSKFELKASIPKYVGNQNGMQDSTNLEGHSAMTLPWLGICEILGHMHPHSQTWQLVWFVKIYGANFSWKLPFPSMWAPKIDTKPHQTFHSTVKCPLFSWVGVKRWVTRHPHSQPRQLGWFSNAYGANLRCKLPFPSIWATKMECKPQQTLHGTGACPLLGWGDVKFWGTCIHIASNDSCCGLLMHIVQIWDEDFHYQVCGQPKWIVNLTKPCMEEYCAHSLAGELWNVGTHAST